MAHMLQLLSSCAAHFVCTPHARSASEAATSPWHFALFCSFHGWRRKAGVSSIASEKKTSLVEAHYRAQQLIPRWDRFVRGELSFDYNSYKQQRHTWCSLLRGSWRACSSPTPFRSMWRVGSEERVMAPLFSHRSGSCGTHSMGWWDRSIRIPLPDRWQRLLGEWAAFAEDTNKKTGGYPAPQTSESASREDRICVRAGDYGCRTTIRRQGRQVEDMNGHARTTGARWTSER